jgi:DNA-binding MarR family transcriptional regulator
VTSEPSDARRSVRGVSERLPLSTLLSFALVAFTIELDNEFEHQMPHRTATGATAKSTAGPWLVSLAMWANFMRYIPESGAPLHELDTMARMTNLAGLTRWGYLKVETDAEGVEIVRTTRAGRKAQQIWAPLPAVVERRWRERFGADAIEALRTSLGTVIGELEPELPLYLPVVRQGLATTIPKHHGWLPTLPGSAVADPLELSALLAQALLAFTLEFEADAALSLPIAANPLRVLDDRGTRIRDLPRLTGLSKEAISIAMGTLERRGAVVVEADPSSTRGKHARLTSTGMTAQAECRKQVDQVEKRWQRRYGAAAVGALRAALEPIVGDGSATESPLFGGLTPYPDGWRASVRPAATLPHHPAVLHRGGYPDGA